MTPEFLGDTMLPQISTYKFPKFVYLKKWYTFIKRFPRQEDIC